MTTFQKKKSVRFHFNLANRYEYNFVQPVVATLELVTWAGSGCRLQAQQLFETCNSTMHYFFRDMLREKCCQKRLVLEIKCIKTWNYKIRFKVIKMIQEHNKNSYGEY